MTKIQKVDQLDGPLYQLEESGHTFEITITGAAGELSGTVSARFLRPDEVTEYFTGTLSGNVASITLPQQCYLVNGRFGMVVFLSGDDVSTAIYAASGNVYRSTSDTVVDPTETIPSLEDLIARFNDMQDAIDDCNAAADAALAVAGDIAVAGTGTEALTLSSYDLINCTVSASATLTVSGTTYQSRKIVRNPMWDSISITANSTGATYATFVTSAFPSTITSGADISGALATGETGRHEIATNATAEFAIPANTAYIIITTKSTSNRTPSAVVTSTKVYNELASYMNTADTKMIVGDRAINTAGLLVAPYDDLNTLPRGT
ncbi:MAG: hypothetical protein IIX61_08770, partial [Loktanella sp.]|nr:hypothetical protein [Loktanella sp.]